MSTNYKDFVSSGYYNEYYGWIIPDDTPQQQAIEDNFIVSGDSIQIGGPSTNNITLGNGGPGTSNILKSETTAIGDGGAKSNTIVNSEDFAVGRYIYMNSANDPGITDTSMDFGLAGNVAIVGELKFNINGYGINGTTNKIHVATAVGALPTQFIAIKSEKNTGIYECLSHVGNEITILTTPIEPFSRSGLVDEDATGWAAVVKISVIRGTNDGDTAEVAVGTSSGLTYHKILYDTKSTGILGNISLSDGSNQLKMKNTTISAAGSTHTHSIKDTNNDEFTMNNASQLLKNKQLEDSSTSIVDSSDTSKAIKFDAAGTTGTSTTLLSSQTTNKTLTLPDKTDVLVARTTADTLTNKTAIDNTNNLLSRGFFVNSGGASVSTYAMPAPTTGQILAAASSSTTNFITPYTITAGNGLNGTTAGGSTNTSSTFTLNRDLDDPNDPGGPGATPPSPLDYGASFAFTGLASFNCAFACAGIIAGFGGVFSHLNVNSSGDGGVGMEVGGGATIDDLNITNDVTVQGNQIVNGDLTVLGSSTFVTSNNLALDSQYIYLNVTDNINTAVPCGLVSTRFPGATIYTLSNFVIGNGATDPVCDADTVTGLVAGDFLEFYSCSDTPTTANLGIYEVNSIVGSVIHFKGPHVSCVEAFTKNNLVTDAVNMYSAVKIQLNALEFDTSGNPMFLSGGNTGTLTRQQFAYNTSSPIFAGLTLSSVPHDDSQNKVLVLNSSTGVVDYRDASTLTSSFLTSETIGNLVISSAGGATSNLHFLHTLDAVEQLVHYLSFNVFDHTLVSTDTKLTVAMAGITPPNLGLRQIMYATINGTWEELYFSWPSGSSNAYIHRKVGSFPAGAEVAFGNGVPGVGSSEIDFQIIWRNI
jgi:hypothetical protein